MSCLTCAQVGFTPIQKVFSPYGLALTRVADGDRIPGSYWGEPEAGLIGNRLYLRSDTPVHSAFHEACHYVCANHARRAAMDTDAGGDDLEENGVCFLQILLANHLPAMGRTRMFRDMDAWGYSFRLGSARTWFDADAEDAKQWLVAHGIVTADLEPTWRLRRQPAVHGETSDAAV